MSEPNVYLGGFMGTGKTTTGRRLAERTGRPFIDLDGLVESRLGLTVARIFAERGEAFFRDVEARLVGEIADLKGLVVALGGGTLVDEASRRRLLATGRLVILRARPETIGRRLGSGEGRPLLAGGDMEALLASREEAYSRGELLLDVDDLDAEEAARRIAERLGLRGAPREGEARSLPGRTIFVGRGILKRWRDLPGAPSRPFVVADELTGPLYGPLLGERLGESLLPRGEGAKRLDRVRELYGAFDRSGLDRSGSVLALGGGTVGDAAGFAAATWMRGVDVVHCPTTLLAQLDSSLGGKVGVNLDEGKNLVGAFHQPRLVVADVDLLRTLSDGDYRQGLAEAVKYGLGEDGALFDEMEKDAPSLLDRDGEVLERLVRRCGAIKMALVDEDERERSGARARLNLGHTVGHALEAASAYGRWSHGDGVAAGLVVVTVLAEKMGLVEETTTGRLLSLLRRLGLPWRPDLPWGAIEGHLKRDKKFEGGRPRLVLPREGRKAVVEEVPLADLKKAYEEVLLWNATFSLSSTDRI